MSSFTYQSQPTDSNVLPKESVEVPKEQSKEMPQEAPKLEPKRNLREAVPRFVSFANMFKVCYVQRDPLPPAIHLLQSLHTDGLTFLKIPINDKEDRLYLESPIKRLLALSRVDAGYIELVCREYTKSPNAENRSRLLNLVRLARDYCDYNDIEFLVDPAEKP